MQSWTEGYVAEVDYTHGFYRELAPTHLNYVLLCKGLQAPPLDRAFTYCELGCGQGNTTNLLAAANPQGDFYATDFNPSHIVHAQTLAREIGLKNIHFFDDSFQDFADRAELPDFDFITLHGVFSWISPENRQQIVNFIRKKLKVGGVVYLSYNAMPGWSAFLGMRELIQAQVLSQSGQITKRFDLALNFAKAIAEQEAIYFKSQPAALDRLQQISTMSRNYLVHEYCNRHFTPLFHREVVELLDEAKASFLVSAHLGDQMEHFRLQPNQLQTLQTIEDPVLRETLRDVYTNQSFRRDIFGRGTVPLASLAQRDRLDQQTFALTLRSPQIPQEYPCPVATVHLDAEPFKTIIAGLSDRPHTMAELAQQLPKLAWRDLHLSLAIAVDGGWAMPVVPQAAVKATRETCHRFNRAIARRALTENKIQLLAAPLVGSGIAVDQTILLFLESMWRKTPGPELAFETYKRMGLKLQKNGETVESDAENLQLLKTSWEQFQSQTGPWLKSLQIL